MLSVSVALAIIALGPAPAQTLEERVLAGGPDVRFSYASRPGVCGDGRDVIGYGRATFIWPWTESFGGRSDARCAPGLVRVQLSVADRRVTRLRARVGGDGRAAAGTDLGRVPAREAAEYFLSLAASGGDVASREAVLAAALADSSDVAPALLRVARDASRPNGTRRRAVRWSGIVGTPAVVPELEAIARGSDARAGLREEAVFALAQLPDAAGVTSVVALAERAPHEDVRKAAAFWLGQVDDPRGRATLRHLIADRSAPAEVRKTAIFAISQGDSAGDDDVAYLESAYRTLESEQLKRQAIFALSQIRGGDGLRWMLGVARDPRESVEMKRTALFWAGQGGAPIADLAAAYDELREPEVKEHLIFVLSQRSDSAALDKMIAIARTDPDREMRRKAIFWLGQRHDARARDLLQELVSQ